VWNSSAESSARRRRRNVITTTGAATFLRVSPYARRMPDHAPLGERITADMYARSRGTGTGPGSAQTRDRNPSGSRRSESSLRPREERSSRGSRERGGSSTVVPGAPVSPTHDAPDPVLSASADRQLCISLGLVGLDDLVEEPLDVCRDIQVAGSVGRPHLRRVSQCICEEVLDLRDVDIEEGL